ncbi:hypothetical protein K488DRAFT_47285 [Vararia minispora EC-137]|uniref:Uncharacterized protein n=1 Tax=Vararia minispora EC-137 TaxID=1314806 RepID=A0ACB8QPQ3_9AGAM|nr:hypothetical protein K488DRAFT_47285 [Vararia minispora EC-137]
MSLLFPPVSSVRKPLVNGLEVVPFFACVYAHALLVMLPKTKLLRLAMLPISLRQSYYAITYFDYAATAGNLLKYYGYRSDRLGYINFFTVIVLILFAGRCIEWAFEPGCHRRFFPPVENDAPFQEHPVTPEFLFIDAFELCWNHTGVGWSWSRKPFPPPPSGHTVLRQASTVIFDAVCLDVLLYLVQLHHPSLNTPSGYPLMDPSSPPVARILRAIASCLSALPIIMFLLDGTYNIVAVFGRVVLGQEAWQWPPIFHWPFLAGSLADFWGRRWHRVPRRMFVQLGARPGRRMGGDVGAIVGAFLVSAVLHDWAIWSMAGRSTTIPCLIMFMAIAAGILLEGAFTKVTGRKVGGFWGWLWMISVQVACGFGVVDHGLARSGLAASDCFPPQFRPGKYLVDVILRVCSSLLVCIKTEIL